MADPAATLQKRILEVLTQIEQLLTEVVDLQKPHVQRVCPACQDRCCKRVHYLYSEKDVLFLRLSGRQLKWRRETLKRKGCWFLGPDGCMLDPKSRPFICHSYVCSELEQEMEKEAPGLLAALREKFRAIEELRAQLWTAYLERRLTETPTVREQFDGKD
jgi:hypothetical protein